MISAEVRTPVVSIKWVWAGRIVSALPVLALLMSGTMKLVGPPSLAEGFAHLGWPADLALGLGILELACTLAYVIPRTAVLGAVLLTGYLGGAVATHVRIGDAYFGPIVLGILIWLGLILRDARLRTLLPLRRDAGAGARRGILPIVLGMCMAFAAIVVVFVIVIALQPGDFRVVRSTTIAATPAEVYAQVDDFHKWDAWSPWLELDPTAKVAFAGPTAGTGAVFTWSGNDEVGAGRMTMMEARPCDRIKIKLDFTRPFESTCNVAFAFEPKGNQTLVTWSMDGKNGFLSKTFCLFVNMDRMIGDRFDKGLAQMKAVTEGKGK